MRIPESTQQLLDEARRTGGLQFVRVPGAPEPAPASGAHPAWSPAPSPANGSLVQDPDFELPTTAGPLKWSLYHDSRLAAEDSEWGYGRRASFPLRLNSDGVTVTVTHEDGSSAQYRLHADSGRYFPVGDNYRSLRQNDDGTWDETDRETGIELHFPTGSAADVISRVTPHGYRLTYEYDGSQRLVRVVEPAQRCLTLGYDANDRVEYVEDWGGRRNTLTYDGSGNLIEVEGPTGCVTQYDYDAGHRLTGIVDPEGYETTYTYDPSGRVATRSVAGNLGRYTYQVDVNGVVTMTYFDPLGRIWTHVNSGNGNPLATIDPLGNRETFLYVNYRPFQKQDALGNVTSYAYSAGNLVAERDPLGHRTTYMRDGYGNVTQIINSLGAVTSISYGSDPRLRRPVTMVNGLAAIWTYGYTAWGAPEFTEDPLGFRTTIVWNELGLIDADVNALGHRQSYVYDLVANRTAAIDPLGHRWSFYYDAMGRIVARENPLGSRWSTLYDSRGSVCAEINPLGHRTSYLWNASQSQTVLIDALGRRTSSVYDLANQHIAQVSPLGSRTSYHFDAAGQQIAAENPLGLRQSAAYDASGRQIEQINALGVIVTTQYDSAGRVVAEVDGLGRRTTSVFDALGQVIVRVNPAGVWHSIAYNIVGSPISFQNPSGSIWTSVYDVLQREIEVIDPLNRRETHVFDAGGNRILRTDSRGWPTTYEYDPLSREALRCYRSGERITWMYSSSDQLLEQSDWTGATSYRYDRAEQPVEQLLPSSQVLTYSYDPVGSRVSLQDPSGQTTYTYDLVGRITGILNPFGEKTTFNYDEASRLIARVLSNGMEAEHVYDAANRCVILSNRYQDGTTLAAFTASYDNAGNCTRREDADGGILEFRYDESYQLINELRMGLYPYNITYQYDASGNRLLRAGGTVEQQYEVDAANQVTRILVSGQPIATFDWDENGNLSCETVGDNVSQYTWDAENRLVSEIQSGVTTTYTYSGRGLRYRRDTGVEISYYIWDNENLLFETNNDLQVISRFTDYPGWWGGLVSQRRESISSFYGFDMQASARVIVDDSGGLTDSYSFRAFGEAVVETGSTINPYRYLGLYGYYWDTADRTYVRARHLRHDLGRWISRDPIRGEDQNQYWYASNRPVDFADPSGETPIKLILGVIAVIGGVWFLTCGAMGAGSAMPLNRLPWYRGRDKLAHCMAACVVRRCGTIVQSWCWGHLKELIVDTLSGGGPNPADYRANNRGEWCAKQVNSFKQCGACCSRIYRVPSPILWRPIMPWNPPPTTVFPGP